MEQLVDCSLYKVHERYPDCTAVVYGDRFCTYRQLHDAMRGFGAHLRSMGMRPGDKARSGARGPSTGLLRSLASSAQAALPYS